MAADHSLPPNAFLHPNNPFAVFPQTSKPDIMDFRINKMKHGGLVAIGAFRKNVSKNAKQSKYATIIKTTAMLKQEEEENAMFEEQEILENEPLQVATSSKVTTVEDLAAMTASLELGKKKKAKLCTEDVEMPKISVKSKGIKKPCKKLRKQLGF
jgi:hypothetical protein